MTKEASQFHTFNKKRIVAFSLCLEQSHIFLCIPHIILLTIITNLYFVHDFFTIIHELKDTMNH